MPGWRNGRRNRLKICYPMDVRVRPPLRADLEYSIPYTAYKPDLFRFRLFFYKIYSAISPLTHGVKKAAGVELLSHTLTYSIIVAGPLNNRVRDGNVCCKTAVNTGEKNQAHGAGSGMERDAGKIGRERALSGIAGKKKSGVELLSHTLTYSIIVAGPLNNRVRDGNVCCKTAINTGKNK